MPNLPYRPPPVAALRRRVSPAPKRRARPTLAREAVDELRRAPWFLTSAALHAALLVILATIMVRQAPPEELAGSFVVGLVADKPSPVDAPPPPEPAEIEPHESLEPEVEPAPPPKDPMPLIVPPPPRPAPPAPRDDRNSVKAAPVLEVPGNDTPARDVFAARRPAERRAALRRWGGSAASEQAVDAGLDWLDRHQHPDIGLWNDGEPAMKLAPGLSSLALLAFLGKGHSHTAPGPYRDTLARGLDALLAIQTSDGRFGEPYLANGERNNRYLMYHQALATMALAEAYAVSQDPRLRDPVRRAVALIERAQQDAGGWDYSDAPTGRNDTSVTGWQIMALKSAHAAGVDVRWQTLFGVMRHLDFYTNSAGEVSYANRDPGAWRRGPGMAAVGLLCYEILGWPRDGERMVRQAELILRHPPDWEMMTRTDRNDLAASLHTMYYWYYATLALFNMGGRPWREWNSRLRDMLIAHQRTEGERRGSWDPPERGFDAVGGRVYTTAINVLTLEIYYRYLPFYRGGSFDATEVLEQAMKARGMPATRRRALRMLAAFRTPRARELLVSALDDRDPATRSVVQRALVEQRCEHVVPTLVEQLAGENVFGRTQAVAGLEAFGRPEFVPHFIRALRDPERVVRDRAATALRRVTDANFGFQPGGEAAGREHAVKRWEAWWQAHSATVPPGGVRGTVLVVDPDADDAVVLDVGSNNGVRRGLRFRVVRDGAPPALLEADRVEPTLTVARVLERGQTPLREGDRIESIPETTVTRLDDD